MELAIGFIAAAIPSVLLYFWLKKQKDDPNYKKSCRSAFWKGVLAVFPVLLCSFIFALLEGLLFKDANPLLTAAIHDFIVLAFSEELVKYLSGRKVIRNALSDVSWLDMVIYMGIVGIGFGVAEDIPYALESSVLVMVIRGIPVSHGVYGMMTGYFLGKMVKEDRKPHVAALLVPWLYHGLYDFGLSEELEQAWDLAAFVPVTLAVGEVVLLILFIRFIRRARNDEKYTSPLIRKTAPEAVPAAPNQTTE